MTTLLTVLQWSLLILLGSLLCGLVAGSLIKYWRHDQEDL